MAASPDFKIYRRGEYVAACKYLEDAAALVGMSGGSVRYGHTRTIYPDTVLNQQRAADSVDEAADVMRRNLMRTKRRPVGAAR